MPDKLITAISTTARVDTRREANVLAKRLKHSPGHHLGALSAGEAEFGLPTSVTVVCVGVRIGA